MLVDEIVDETDIVSFVVEVDRIFVFMIEKQYLDKSRRTPSAGDPCL